MFFAISGFLVTQSWDRDQNAIRFLTRRALRIFPGLLSSIFACAFVIGPLVTHFTLSEYFSSPVFFKFCRNIILFPIKFSLPGVFTENPFKGAVNGSLWTLPMEVTMYLILVAAASKRLWTTRNIFLFATLLFALELYLFKNWRISESPHILTMNAQQLTLSGISFMAGAILAKIRENVFRMRNCVPMLIIILATHQHTIVTIIIVLFVPYMSICFGKKHTKALRNADKFGDLSYGIYIYAFPIQQLSVYLSPSINIYYFTIISIFIPAAAAFISWHIIERPALKFKPVALPTQQSASNHELVIIDSPK